MLIAIGPITRRGSTTTSRLTSWTTSARGWKADEKALHLKGEVEQAADKARAEELAKQVVGTSGRVVNEVTVEGTHAEATDEYEEQLDRAFKEDDEWDKDKLDLTFDSKAGVVTITGDAPTEVAKQRVEQKPVPFPA